MHGVAISIKNQQHLHIDLFQQAFTKNLTKLAGIGQVSDTITDILYRSGSLVDIIPCQYLPPEQQEHFKHPLSISWSSQLVIIRHTTRSYKNNQPSC